MTQPLFRAARLVPAALLALAPHYAGCNGSNFECFACLDTFVVYVKGEADWLGDGYPLEVDADGVVYKCKTGTAARIGNGAVRCGKKDDAPLIAVRGSDDEPIVRIGFWETTPSEVQVTVRDGDEVLARGNYKPAYEEVPAGNTCPVCERAESKTLKVEDSEAP